MYDHMCLQIKGTGRAGRYRWYNPDRKEEEKTAKKKKKVDEEEKGEEKQEVSLLIVSYLE